MAKPYQVLGVDPGASEAVINAAFRRAAKDCHPDLHANDPRAARRFRRLVAARKILTDPPGRRLFYARSGAPQSLTSRSRKQRKAARAVGAIAGTAALLMLFFADQIWGPQLTVGPFQTATVLLDNEDTEDDGVADLKAIRDMEEQRGSESLQDDTFGSGNSNSPRRAGRPRLGRHPYTVRATVFQLSRKLRMLASNLNGT
jgi:curved DNA-binding protein CbpA